MKSCSALTYNLLFINFYMVKTKNLQNPPPQPPPPPPPQSPPEYPPPQSFPEDPPPEYELPPLSLVQYPVVVLLFLFFEAWSVFLLVLELEFSILVSFLNSYEIN